MCWGTKSLIKTKVPPNIGVMSNWSYCSCFTVHLPRGYQMFSLGSGSDLPSNCMIKSIHEILYVNTHIPTCYRISFPKVKACITVSLSICQVKTSNLLVPSTGLKWKIILHGIILAWRLREQRNNFYAAALLSLQRPDNIRSWTFHSVI